jgi:hypothetical protein
MNLALTLDAEIKRVSNKEQISIEDLVKEVARITECSTRQVYNYRSGKWLLPGEHIPALCKRFGSRALLHALEDSCRETPIEIPEDFDLTRLVSQTVREDLKYYEQFLDDFESDGGIDPSELVELRELAERVIGNAYRFVEIASDNCERRQLQRASKG